MLRTPAQKTDATCALASDDDLRHILVKHGAMDTYGTVQMLLNACKPPITVDFEGGM